MTQQQGGAAASPPLEATFHGFVADTMDSLILFEGCLQAILMHVPRRPHDRERETLIRSGSVFVYEEHSSGIKRWTDGYNWSPSRILGNFLIYRELEGPFPPGEKKRARRDKNNNKKPGGISRPGSNSSGVSAAAVARVGSSFENGDQQQRQSDCERSLIGSLVDSYPFKENGLVKKTISITWQGVPHHLVSYYKVEDVQNHVLRSVSETLQLRSIIPRAALFSQQNFRNPVSDTDPNRLLVHVGPNPMGSHYEQEQHRGQGHQLIRHPLHHGLSGHPGHSAHPGHPGHHPGHHGHNNHHMHLRQLQAYATHAGHPVHHQIHPQAQYGPIHQGTPRSMSVGSIPQNNWAQEFGNHHNQFVMTPHLHSQMSVGHHASYASTNSGYDSPTGQHVDYSQSFDNSGQHQTPTPSAEGYEPPPSLDGINLHPISGGMNGSIHGINGNGLMNVDPGQAENRPGEDDFDNKAWYQQSLQSGSPTGTINGNMGGNMAGNVPGNMAASMQGTMPGTISGGLPTSLFPLEGDQD